MVLICACHGHFILSTMLGAFATGSRGRNIIKWFKMLLSGILFEAQGLYLLLKKKNFTPNKWVY